MQELVKIKEVSSKYDISARTLRYYEEIGLLKSERSSDYSYRMYDAAALLRLEQILILRKLDISIKDIQRIFSTQGAEVVLEVLGNKVSDIDEEVALLHELKKIVLAFISQIEKADFRKEADVKQLYEKASLVKKQLSGIEEDEDKEEVKVEDSPMLDIEHLNNINERLRKVPEVRVVQLPKCRMATSGFDTFDKTLGDFPKWWSEYEKKRKGVPSFCAQDFMWDEDGQQVWWLAVEDDATTEDVGGYEIIDFEGGLYAMATSVDGDDDISTRVHKGIIRWLKTTGFQLDDRKGHRIMYHMESPIDEVKKGLGYHQLDMFVPIKLKTEEKINGVSIVDADLDARAGFGTDWTEYETIRGDFDVTYKFHNYGYLNNGESFENVVLEITTDGIMGTSQYEDANYLDIVLNGTAWFWNAAKAKTVWKGNIENKCSDVEKTILKDADVELNIVRSGEDIIVNGSFISGSEKGTWHANTKVKGLQSTLNVHLTGEGCVLTNLEFKVNR